MIVVCVLMTMLAFAGCGKKDNNTSTAEQATKPQAIPVEQFKAPAEVVKIDTEAEDPSNDDIKFTYDEEGRVNSCSYSFDGHEASLTYIYTDGKEASIYSYVDGIYVKLDRVPLPEDYDPNGDFSDQDGYYFKGY